MTALSRQVIRAASRSLTKLLRRSSIEAGGGGRRWEGASTLASPQASTLAARGPASKRAAAASVNTPQGARIVEAWTAALVGKGWQARSQHPDTAIARAMNSSFEPLCGPMLPGLARALVRDGEAFFRLRVTQSGVLRLQQIAAEHAGDSLLVIHFDADSETWVNFDGELAVVGSAEPLIDLREEK